MTLIRCSECGRTVSDKAAACIGCGAPLPQRSGLNIGPVRPKGPPPTRAQLLYRAGACVLAFGVGVLGSSRFDHSQAGPARVVSTLAALLVVIGLCGAIVTGVQLLLSRR